MRVEKTVFISYRRTNIFHARAIFQDLRANGYDAFLDFESLDTGSFEQIILNQVRARAHFLVILTPSALERSADPNDWLRREIETALDSKRNVIPLMFDGFDWNAAEPHLTGKLALLKEYNALRIPSDFFQEAMIRIRTRFLNVDLDSLIHPAPIVINKPPKKLLTMLEEIMVIHALGGLTFDWYDHSAAIKAFTKEIQEDPESTSSYFYRAYVYYKEHEYDRAIADCNQAITLNPQISEYYHLRCDINRARGDYQRAIYDCDTALRLDPDDSFAQNQRENLLREIGR